MSGHPLRSGRRPTHAPVLYSPPADGSTVAEVDVITAPRTPQPNLDAIYLLMPTSQNVALILKDFAPGEPLAAQPRTSKKNAPPPLRQEPPKYAAAHLHFVDGERGRCDGVRDAS